jgi:hypothetical protein
MDSVPQTAARYARKKWNPLTISFRSACSLEKSDLRPSGAAVGSFLHRRKMAPLCTGGCSQGRWCLQHRAFDSLVLLIAWVLWLERNGKEFSRDCRPPVRVLEQIWDMVEFWRRAQLLNRSQLFAI